MTANEYIENILLKYKARDNKPYETEIKNLLIILKKRANTCYLDILLSWSRAKWTAISLCSDYDYMVSLTSNCNEKCGWLPSIFNSLYDELKIHYINVRKQNVSCRITIWWELEIDITPARKLPWNTNDHIIYSSKSNTWTKTNIQQHINDIRNSWRLKEIKALKIWRELHNLDIPSIYLEYLIIDILKWKSRVELANNVLYVLWELWKKESNPLFKTIIDPANTNNILSDLLNKQEKKTIIFVAKQSINEQFWHNIIR